MGICRFLWAQKGPSMLHAVTMTLVGLKVALQKDWMPRDLAGATMSWSLHSWPWSWPTWSR